MFSMNTTRTIVGIIGNLASVFLRISPLPTIVQIWKKKSVEQYSAAPYLATFLNCGLWVFYGTPIVHPNSLLLLTVNGLGVVITIVYLFVFLYCSDRNNRFKVALIVLAEVVFMAAHAILVLTLAHNWKLRSAIVGSTAGVCNILVYASPLAIMAPNGIGALAGLAQLVLYAKYYKSNKSLDENSQVDIEVGKSEFGLTTHAKKPSSEA
ncbi:bidirectional sugar transporter SWEET7-like isoform X2 [Ipomoea triloba]|uniref:bidirectional sugar transporter SWEET7-like isoform X2 n=1 Tax=Ipomoea triloba TaxID=35885 RepID=UPI00125D4BC2|nr:bidirectional sugar transporter SWEET7-like isoform X2 [Ipomoea triloba]